MPAEDSDTSLCFVAEQDAQVLPLLRSWSAEPALKLCEGGADEAGERGVVLDLVGLAGLDEVTERHAKSGISRSAQILMLCEVREQRDGVADDPRLNASVGAGDGLACREEEVDSPAVRLDHVIGLRELLAGETQAVVLGACDFLHVCVWTRNCALDSAWALLL